MPAPPLQFRVVDVTDTRALLRWTPSPGRVDRFIISYESAKSEFGDPLNIHSGHCADSFIKIDLQEFEKQHYISVGTVRMLMEPSAKH